MAAVARGRSPAPTRARRAEPLRGGDRAGGGGGRAVWIGGGGGRVPAVTGGGGGEDDAVRVRAAAVSLRRALRGGPEAAGERREEPAVPAGEGVAAGAASGVGGYPG